MGYMDVTKHPGGSSGIAGRIVESLGLHDHSPILSMRRRTVLSMRRRTGIEPACDAKRRTPVLKTGGATRHPDASAADVTRARPGAAIRDGSWLSGRDQFP